MAVNRMVEIGGWWAAQHDLGELNFYISAANRVHIREWDLIVNSKVRRGDQEVGFVINWCAVAKPSHKHLIPIKFNRPTEL